MRFNNDRPIFVQIADFLTREIIAGHLVPDERIASARELASSLEVNPNTAARALQALAESGVARCERGTGYFVDSDGPAKACETLRQHFLQTELPGLFQTMVELGIGPEEITSRFAAFRQQAPQGKAS